MFRFCLGPALLGIVVSIAAPPASAQRIYGAYRVLPAGTTTKLGFHYFIDTHCRSQGAVQVNVITSPSGGDILSQAGAGHPRVPPGSKLARCNARTVAGTSVFYQAKPGFAGTDRFVLEDMYPDRTARQFPITVSVR